MLRADKLYIRDKKELYLVKKHSNFYDDLNKPIPTNITDIETEINKREMLEEKLFHILENNPLINYDEFIKLANTEYKDLKCQFTIYPTSWLNLYKKLRNNSGIYNIDYAITNRFTEDNYLFFRKANYQINPFKLNNHISKYIIWFSYFFLKRMLKTECLLIDGTFIKPFGFYQTLIIMYLIPDLEKLYQYVIFY